MRSSAMQLHEVIERLRRHRILVLTVLLVGAVLVVFALRRTPPRYAADASVLLVAEPPDISETAPFVDELAPYVHRDNLDNRRI